MTAAAVADYTSGECQRSEKVKKKDGDMAIELVRTKDILETLGANPREGQFLCGFSMETQNMLENSRAKTREEKARHDRSQQLKGNREPDLAQIQT